MMARQARVRLLRTLQVYGASSAVAATHSFTVITRCKQHCNQPGSFCNRGRASEDFARVIPVEVLFRASDRDVRGTRARQDAGDLDHDGHLYNDSDGCRASEEADLPSTPGISS